MNEKYIETLKTILDVLDFHGSALCLSRHLAGQFSVEKLVRYLQAAGYPYVVKRNTKIWTIRRRQPILGQI